MPEPFSQDLVLVSSPNDGGVSLVSTAGVLVLDRSDCTGVCLSEDTLFRNAIIETLDSKHMQLESYSVASGKRVLATDDGYDFHDIHVDQDRLYLVSTGTNDIIILSLDGKEIGRHAYPGHNDSWHINCLGKWDGRIVVSAFGEFDSQRGYKNNSRSRGFVMDIETNQKLWEGLSQPHTPVQHDGHYFICNSEEKQVLVRDASSGVRCLQFDGYTRGIAFSEHYMYVGLSESRNISSPLSGKARVIALDLATFQTCGEKSIPFSEIYDLRIVKGPSLLPIVFLSLTVEALTSELHQRSRQLTDLQGGFQALHAQFQRVNGHVMTGPLLRLLRWAKGDDTFGNPEMANVTYPLATIER